MAPKVKEETTKPEETALTQDSEMNQDQEKVYDVTHKGACLVTIGGKSYLPEDEFELTQAEIDTWGVKYLFATGVLEFTDNSKDTKALIEAFKTKPEPKKKTLKERENGPTYE